MKLVSALHSLRSRLLVFLNQPNSKKRVDYVKVNDIHIQEPIREKDICTYVEDGIIVLEADFFRLKYDDGKTSFYIENPNFIETIEKYFTLQIHQSAGERKNGIKQMLNREDDYQQTLLLLTKFVVKSHIETILVSIAKQKNKYADIPSQNFDYKRMLM